MASQYRGIYARWGDSVWKTRKANSSPELRRAEDCRRVYVRMARVEDKVAAGDVTLDGENVDLKAKLFDYELGPAFIVTNLENARLLTASPFPRALLGLVKYSGMISRGVEG
ncbi:hypothetical protein EDD22DRAFT_852496 [Suillus occidentalis]|nr:hypothetical protein EDD22DRAFT_852496 [Suillus occidentalis]